MLFYKQWCTFQSAPLPSRFKIHPWPGRPREMSWLLGTCFCMRGKTRTLNFAQGPPGADSSWVLLARGGRQTSTHPPFLQWGLGPVLGEHPTLPLPGTFTGEVQRHQGLGLDCHPTCRHLFADIGHDTAKGRDLQPWPAHTSAFPAQLLSLAAIGNLPPAF